MIWQIAGEAGLALKGRGFQPRRYRNWGSCGTAEGRALSKRVG